TSRKQNSVFRDDWLALFNNIKGNIYFNKGELDTALTCYQNGLSLGNSIPNSYISSLTILNIGTVYYAKSDLTLALRYCQQSKAIAERIGNSALIAYSLFVIGGIYREKGDPDKALEYFQQSLALDDPKSSDIFPAEKLYFLIITCLDQQNQAKAQKFLDRLKELYAHSQNRYIHLRIQLAEALILKQSPRLKHIAQAQAILEKIVKEEMIEFSLTASAMIHLCDLLILEIKATGEQEQWERVKTLIQSLYAKAHTQQAFSMIIDLLLLQAKFAVVEGRLQEAQQLYEEAKIIAAEKHLGLLAQKVEAEYTNFKIEIEKWQAFIQLNTPLGKRLEQAQMTEYLKEVQKIVRRSTM
ncbi:MAG: tetratricopeptide repeat protein, partial [Candidatus Hodarchaeota archaeon]